ncbi:MAG: DoxX family protein [Burkholderiaceae bacterium]
MAAHNFLALIARVFLSLMFLKSGYDKIVGFEGTVGYIGSVGLPMPQVMAVLAIVVELGAGIALVLGFKARWAAAALAVFTVLAAVLFHNYWAMPADKQMLQQIMFLKNIAVTGGLLMVMAFGAGAWSVDRR